jgi:hypothetical protein
MNFFTRSEITVRCSFRGNSLVVPHVDRLLNSCHDADRNRLRRTLSRIAHDEQLWLLTWEREAGDRLVANNRVAVLRLRNIVVELLYARAGTLAEIAVPGGERVRGGDRLAGVANPAKATPPPEIDQDAREMVVQLLERRRRDAEQIKQLRIQLSDRQRQLGELRGELALLRVRYGAGSDGTADRKFVRLKHEFSKRFHPDGFADPTERQLRSRIFQEFWPIVERIERS